LFFVENKKLNSASVTLISAV